MSQTINLHLKFLSFRLINITFQDQNTQKDKVLSSYDHYMGIITSPPEASYANFTKYVLSNTCLSAASPVPLQASEVLHDEAPVLWPAALHPAEGLPNIQIVPKKKFDCLQKIFDYSSENICLHCRARCCGPRLPTCTTRWCSTWRASTCSPSGGTTTGM